MLAFLHTAPANLLTFDGLLREIAPETRARHVVREDLLAAARTRGDGDAEVARAVAEAVAALEAAGATVVLCTCSTIGGLAERAGEGLGATVLRVDRPMAEQAVAAGPRIVVAAALASTLAPTEALIREAAAAAGRDVAPRHLLLDGAWARFEQGDLDGYHAAIAEGLGAIAAEPVDAVVLAQASMAGALERCAGLPFPVLSSPRTGLEAALAALR